MTDQDTRTATIAILIAFLILPMALGAASATAFWRSVEAKTDLQLQRAERLYDPIE